MKKRRNFIQRIIYGVGVFFSLAIVALVSITCIGVKVKAEKEGITFGQAIASLLIPEKQAKETYTGTKELPSLEKIAERQESDKRAALQEPKQVSGGNSKPAKEAKPAAYSAPAKKADEYGICPSCKNFHNLALSCADDRAYMSKVIKEKPKANGKKQAAYASAKANPQPAQTVEPDLQLIRNWQTADNTPQAGRTVGAPKFGDMGQMSDLERQAAYSARNEKAWKELENATAKLRNGQ